MNPVRDLDSWATCPVICDRLSDAHDGIWAPETFAVCVATKCLADESLRSPLLIGQLSGDRVEQSAPQNTDRKPWTKTTYAIL